MNNKRIDEIRERGTTFAYCSNADGAKALEADFCYLLEEVTRLSGLLSGQWVSCSERMPEPYKTVLCRGGSYDAGAQDGYLLAAYYPSETDELAKGDWYYGKQMNEAYDVTHWMPLPEPPLANKADSARGGTGCDQ